MNMLTNTAFTPYSSHNDQVRHVQKEKAHIEEEFHQQVTVHSMSHVVSLSITVSTHQQVRQLEEESQLLQQQLDQSLEMSQQAIQAANRRAEEAQQRIREIENDLHRQVQQLQEQVSSVVFHHTCTVCGVCRWLLLCPHTHSWQKRSSPTGW